MNSPLRRRAGAWTVLAFLAAAACFAQEGNVIIDHADSLVGLELDGEKVQSLIGNVRFRQGKVVVTCNRAVKYPVSKKLTMEGEVEIHDDSVRLVCSRGVYYADARTAEGFDRVLMEDRTTTLNAAYGKYLFKEKKAFFTTHVVVQDTGSVLTANQVVYDRAARQLTADGNVIIVNEKNGLMTYGGHFEHFQDRATSIMTVRPRVVSADSSEDGTRDTLEIFSRVLEMIRDSIPRIIATDSVRIFRGELAAEAGSAVLYSEKDSILLRRSPVAWYSTGAHDENQISGDSIWLQLRDRRLETIHILGRAVAIGRADSLHPERLNQLTGQEITMRFAANKLARLDVERTATSLYFLFDGATPNGLNKTSGDRVSMTFTDGQIDAITFRTDVQGQHIPERLVKGREAEYNLDGFNWRPKPSRAAYPAIK
jgi:lipopolysaccharide export system protein LptA